MKVLLRVPLKFLLQVLLQVPPQPSARCGCGFKDRLIPGAVWFGTLLLSDVGLTLPIGCRCHVCLATSADCVFCRRWQSFQLQTVPRQPWLVLVGSGRDWHVSVRNKHLWRSRLAEFSPPPGETGTTVKETGSSELRGSNQSENVHVHRATSFGCIPTVSVYICLCVFVCVNVCICLS